MSQSNCSPRRDVYEEGSAEGEVAKELAAVTRAQAKKAFAEKEEREAVMAELPFTQEEEVGVEEVLNGKPEVEKIGDPYY